MSASPQTVRQFRFDLSDPRHGTANGYNNLGCRCKRCRRAWAVYYAKLGSGNRYRDKFRGRICAAHGCRNKVALSSPRKGLCARHNGSGPYAPGGPLAHRALD